MIPKIDYSKPPPGYRVEADSLGKNWGWDGCGVCVGSSIDEASALASTWDHYKGYNDPPGCTSDALGVRKTFGHPPWLNTRSAAWAWYDCRLGLAEKWQRIYDTDGDARQLAAVRYRGAGDEMAFDNWWPRCLTWPDEQVAKVERWLADNTVEIPEVLRASPAPAPNQGLLDALATTAGQAIGEGYEIDFGGACPVQGTGLVDGHEAYYRARGDRWIVEGTL